MSYKYCENCGHKNQYIGVLPKFCNNCGSNMSGEKSVKRVVKNSIASKKSKVELNEDETDMDYVPNISKLEYEVSAFEQKTFKLGDIIPTKNDAKEEG